MALNPHVEPLWLRVAFLAWAKLQPNGHAYFGRGGLSREFGLDRRAINRAIRLAVEYAYLHESSCMECLVPPSWLVENGGKGLRRPCRVDHREQLTNVDIERSIEELRNGAVQSVEEGQNLPPLSSLTDDKPLHLLPPQEVSL